MWLLKIIYSSTKYVEFHTLHSYAKLFKSSVQINTVPFILTDFAKYYQKKDIFVFKQSNIDIHQLMHCNIKIHLIAIIKKKLHM